MTYQETSLPKEGTDDSKKTAYRRWKQGQATREKFRNIIWVCLDGLRKAKTQLKPRHSRDTTSNKKSFYNHLGNKRLEKESVSLLLNRVWDFMTIHTGKAEVLRVAFASAGLQAPV